LALKGLIKAIMYNTYFYISAILGKQSKELYRKQNTNINMPGR